MKFELGQLVRLKSGGPYMTVSDTGKNQDGFDVVLCVWFSSSGKCYIKQFLPHVLEKS